MKLRLTTDMGLHRQSGRDQLDRIFASLQPDPRIQTVRDAKADEARRILAGDLDAPLLAAEAANRGVMLQEQATLVLARQRQSRERLAAIEAARQSLQGAIDVARTPAEIDEILAAAGGGEVLS
ncbi:hypothetical protein [Aurantimonas sp. 22II-16-19i]|uniref:hypothetical protein n=1 Tax=Aurantimonas sp. 22II-16-19i TaxID=1317114 RepID=UPI0009F7DB12|nr:hypothetical protein [Aurantimonas sp. 22II-16-19i]ORE89732.1 hypothetical protein ATO4_23677 [Aurantimonas sp. 22II-16-19i]